MTPRPLHRILGEVAQKHCVSVHTIRCVKLNRKLVSARFEFYYRATTETTASLPQIGLVCWRHHSTIIHGLRAYCDKHGLPYPRGANWSPKKKKLRFTASNAPLFTTFGAEGNTHG